MARAPALGDAERERTLLVALLLSAWAPLATGVAVALSHSTTQIADFVRRTVELVSIAVAWAVFRHLRRNDPAPASRLIDGQRRLYRAKWVVDACVIAALATVAPRRHRRPRST